MSFTYKKSSVSAPKTAETPKAPDPDRLGIVPMSALRDALQTPSASLGGHKVDLASAMRSKMESAFGMDFSSLSVYESPMVKAAGANAVADGSTIAFAPGKFDQSSQSGQTLLGHELSHIAAQARGEVRGGGFLDNGALEARADREGAQAAAGQTVYDGDFAGSSASLAPVASAPMQAEGSEEVRRQIAGLETQRRMGVLDDTQYFRSLKNLLKSLSPKDLSNDKYIQEFILNETSSYSNSKMKALQEAKKKSGTTALPGDLFSEGLRGNGDIAFSVFNTMLIRMMGGPKALKDVPSNNAIGDLEELTGRIEKNEDVLNLLMRFSDQAFEGIDLNEEQRSSGIMDAMGTIFAPTVICKESGVAAEDWRDRIRAFTPAKQMATPDIHTGIRNTNDAGKRFLTTVSRWQEKVRPWETATKRIGEYKKAGATRAKANLLSAPHRAPANPTTVTPNTNPTTVAPNANPTTNPKPRIRRNAISHRPNQGN